MITDSWEDAPNHGGGYYFARENIDPVDDDVLLVMVEGNGKVYYGSCTFNVSEFSKWMYVHDAILMLTRRLGE